MAEKQVLPQLDPAAWPTQLFWLAVTFIALYIVISRVAIPRTGGTIAKRRARIDDDLAQAQKFKADTDRAVEAYDAALAQARAKALGIGQANRGKLGAETDAERARLDLVLGTRIAEAEKAIAISRRKAVAEVKDAAADIASSIVSELIGAKVTKTAAADAVAKALKQGG